MKKQTTRQRIEQAVEKTYADRDCTAFSPYEVTELILAERRRMRREVVKLRRSVKTKPADSMEEATEQLGYMGACDDILERLRGL